MTTLYEATVRRLRGRHNSVRHRFFKLPINWTKYLVSRAMGRTWTQHYRTMVDKSAKETDLNNPIVERSLADGARWMPILLKHGLNSQTRFLDFGCGRLRMGLHVVPLLEQGRYLGVDISQATMDNGVKLLQQRGISRDRYDLAWIEDNRLQILKDRMFDMGIAWSVFTHLEIQEVAQVLRSLRPCFAPGGEFMFTFTAGDQLGRSNLKDFTQPIPVMERLVREAGFEFSIEPDWWGGYEEDKLGVARVRH